MDRAYGYSSEGEEGEGERGHGEVESHVRSAVNVDGSDAASHSHGGAAAAAAAAGAPTSASTLSTSAMWQGAARTTTGQVDVNLVPFSVLAQLLSRILSASRSQKERLLMSMWQRVHQPGVSMYPLLRLLLPQLDSERPTYGLRESSLADAYIHALGLSKTLDQAHRLKNYKAPPRSAVGGGMGMGVGGAGVGGSSGVSGDFSLVLLDVLKMYISVKEGESRLTIAQVNEMLDQLAADRERGSSSRTRVFARTVTEMSPIEHMWFTRIILKDLKIGMRHESMLKLFDPAALNMYNSCSDLKLVCATLAQPSTNKEHLTVGRVSYMHAFKPMLASSPPWQSVMDRMRGCVCYVEDKYDGERIVLHKKGETVKMFTRKSIDYTERYGYGKAFIHIVQQALPEHDCIIDGELATYDTNLGQFLKFGSNRSVALGGEGAMGEGAQLCYIAFDIIMLDEESLVDRTLQHRREILHRVVREVPHQFVVIKHRTDVRTNQELLAALTEATGAGKEGLIVKNATAPYLFNDRSDWWIKVKSDYIDGLRDNMDLLLLGGYFGEGTRRSGGVSHFLLGLLDKRPTMEEKERYERERRNRLPPKCYTFCKVGSGYTLARLGELRRELEHKWRKYDPAHQPPHFQGWRHERSDIPDVWIDPRDSVIFELKCYEITQCRPNKFSAGYTCRFPRVVRIRDDKDWSDAMTRDDMLLLAEPSLRSTNNEQAYPMPQIDAAAPAHAMPAELESASALQPIGHAAQPPTDTHAHAIPPVAVMEMEHEWSQPLPAGGVASKREHESNEMEQRMTDSDHAVAHDEAGLMASAAAADDAWSTIMQQHHQPQQQVGLMGEVGVSVSEESRGRRGGKKRKAKEQTQRQSLKRGSVLSLFRPTDVSDIRVRSSDLFLNKCFCVMSGDATPSKSDIEKLISMHGGTFSQNVLPHTFCIIARREETVKVRVQREARKKDILHWSWLYDSVRAGRLMPLTPQYVLSATPQTQAAMGREVDRYGDSYTQLTDPTLIHDAINAINTQHPFMHHAQQQGNVDINHSPTPDQVVQERRMPQLNLNPHHSLSSSSSSSSSASLLSQLYLAEPAPSFYRSRLLQFNPMQQHMLDGPLRAWMGFDVFIPIINHDTHTHTTTLTLTLRLTRPSNPANIGSAANIAANAAAAAPSSSPAHAAAPTPTATVTHPHLHPRPSSSSSSFPPLLRLCRLSLQQLGAHISEECHADITHILIPNDCNINTRRERGRERVRRKKGNGNASINTSRGRDEKDEWSEEEKDEKDTNDTITSTVTIAASAADDESEDADGDGDDVMIWFQRELGRIGLQLLDGRERNRNRSMHGHGHGHGHEHGPENETDRAHDHDWDEGHDGMNANVRPPTAMCWLIDYAWVMKQRERHCNAYTSNEGET